MDDLVAFLRACLDEDEALAKAAAKFGTDGIAGRAHWSARYGAIVTDEEDPDWAILDVSLLSEADEIGAHVARWDPARVLREVAAKRAILDLHKGDESDYGGYRPDGTWQRGGLVCLMCGHDDGRLGIAWPCPTVRHMAAVYSDRPGYRQEWAP